MACTSSLSMLTNMHTVVDAHLRVSGQCQRHQHLDAVLVKVKKNYVRFLNSLMII